MKANNDILKNMQTNMTSLTNSNLELKNMFGQFMKMNTASSSGLRTHPGNIITNLKEDLKGITTRSRTAYLGPTIPTTSSSPVVKRETEATKNTMHPTNNGSTKDIQPSVVLTPIIEPVASPVSAPRPNQRPSILYLSRLHDQKLRDKANDQREKFFQISKDLNFNISFADALILMPKFVPSIKSLLTNKDKLCKLARTPLNEHCLAVLLKKLPEKLGDPGKFLIPCDFPRMAECLTLADLGASINLMPLLHDQKLRDKTNDQKEKFFQIFQDLNFDISFADALIIMPKFSPTIKSWLTNKEKLFELTRTPLNEHCSAVLLKELLEKLGDPGKFLIPCDFLRMDECLALTDLMPLSMWKMLSLPELSPIYMTLKLADRSISCPVRVAEDVSIKLGRFHFLSNFVVVDFDADPRVPLIIRRSFLKTECALIDVYEGELTLRVGKKVVTFNLDQTSRYSSSYDDNLVNRIDVIDIDCEEYSQEVKEDLKGITTRSGIAYKGPTMPTTSSPPKVVERETEVIKDTMPPTNKGRTKDIQLPVVQVETQILNFEPVVALVVEPIIKPVEAPVSAPKPNPKLLIPYPSRLHDQK
nr:reverse transcriptase domain-containing protein [Tanacetum cinerariifolium]